MNFYLYFDQETGIVQEVSSHINDGNPKIEIGKELYVKFIEGVENFSNWQVIKSTSNNGLFELVEKSKVNVNTPSRKSFSPLKKFNSIQEIQDVFQIVQKNYIWIVYANLTDQFKYFLESSVSETNNKKNLYLTSENDQRQLLDVVSFPLLHFIKKERFVLPVNLQKKVDIYSTFQNLDLIHIIDYNEN